MSKSLTTSDIVLVKISSVIELGEEGEEACEDMVFMYVFVLAKKLCTQLQLQVKLVYGYKSIFGFGARVEMIDFFCIDHMQLRCSTELSGDYINLPQYHHKIFHPHVT